MKRFDPQAILARMINNLQSKDNWNSLQEDGATQQLLEALAESPAEIARYGEYLLQELKWDTSRNYSSTKQMAKLVSKKLDRKHSAIGTIIVSHSDLEGSPRFSYLGSENFVIDNESNYDDRTLNTSLTDDMYKRALTPWLDTNTYSIPLHAIFTTQSGINFVCAERKTIQCWQSTWKSVNQSSKNLDYFKADGGWNNYKYLTVPIVQGVEKTVYLGESSGEGAQTFLVATLDIEAADSYYTEQFCYIEVLNKGETEPTVWHEVQHIQTAESTDQVFEINILDDMSGTEIKFGDSVCGAIPSKEAQITLHYLETKGEDGNVTELYKFSNEISGVEYPESTIYPGLAVGCQNMWPIIGGKNLENLAEFKASAETAYAKNYEILHTYSELEDQINTISPIPLIKVKTSTFYEESTVNATKIYRNAIGITGLATSMEPLSSLEKTIFESVLNQKINSKVLANKLIRYLSPPIVKIDSALEVELKKPILNKQDFKKELAEYLQSTLGKANTDTIDSYMQSDILRYALEYSDNIGAIQATNLFTLDCTKVSFGHTTDDPNGFFFAFEFELPKLYQNALSRDEGGCNRTIKDGNELPYIFNVGIAGNKSTLVVVESNTNTEQTQGVYTYEESNYYEDASVINYYSNPAVVTENLRYSIRQILEEKHTFTRTELADADNVTFRDTSSYSFETVRFYVSRSTEDLKAYLILDARSIAEQLGFYDPDAMVANSATVLRVYTALRSSIEDHYSNVSFSFEPVDKTVESDWNTIMYYNNIDVILT